MFTEVEAKKTELKMKKRRIEELGKWCLKNLFPPKYHYFFCLSLLKFKIVKIIF